MLQIQTFNIEGPLLILLKQFNDERGFFVERFNADRFKDAGLPYQFCQDNHSQSLPNVLRGLHYQYNPAQGKMVTCLSGHIVDVAVDIRHKSPTYGQHIKVELSALNPAWLWIPPGFAHGFYVPQQESAVDVLYKVDSFYSPKSEACLQWNDPTLAIPWPTTTPILSSKDQAGESFTSYKNSPKF